MTLFVDRADRSREPNRARPYTLTGGRTRSTVDLPIEATVETIALLPESDWPPGDIRAEIFKLGCNRPSIAEISALAGIPIGVTRVLVGDLVESRHVRVHATLTERSSVSERRRLIERTLSGLRAL